MSTEVAVCRLDNPARISLCQSQNVELNNAQLQAIYDFVTLTCQLLLLQRNKREIFSE